MRITSTVAHMQYYMQQSADAFAEAQTQVATGMRVNKPSDDPIASARYAAASADTANNDQYSSNVTNALARLQASDSALSSVVTTITSAISAGTNAANGTNNSKNQETLASQLEGYLSSIVSQGNTTYQGRALFSGTVDTSAPFVQAYGGFHSSATSLTSATALTAGSMTVIGDASTGKSLQFRAGEGDTVEDLQNAIADAVKSGVLSSDVSASINSSGQLEITGAAGVSVSTDDAALGAMSADTDTKVSNAYAYMGNSGVNQSKVGNSLTVDNNVAGDSLFTTGTGVLGSLKGLIDAVRGGNSSSIGTATAAVSAALSKLTAVRAKMDNSISQLDSQDTYLSNEKVTLKSSQSALVKIDLTEAATNLSQAELTNSATLAAAAKSMSQTLLDYLR